MAVEKSRNSINQKKRDAFKNLIFATEIEELIHHSKTYKDVITHRRRCIKWQKRILCIDCWGGGLTMFTAQFVQEMNEKYPMKRVNEVKI